MIFVQAPMGALDGIGGVDHPADFGKEWCDLVPSPLPG
jgi:hypothetical protein